MWTEQSQCCKTYCNVKHAVHVKCIPPKLSNTSDTLSSDARKTHEGTLPLRAVGTEEVSPVSVSVPAIDNVPKHPRSSMYRIARVGDGLGGDVIGKVLPIATFSC
jgi:hypothetical protein